MLVENDFEAVELFPDMSAEDQKLDNELEVRIRHMTIDSPPLQGIALDKRADAVLLIKANGREFSKSALLASDYLELLVAIANTRKGEYFGTCSVTINANVVSHPETLEKAITAMSKLWFSRRNKQRLTP